MYVDNTEIGNSCNKQKMLKMFILVKHEMEDQYVILMFVNNKF